MTKYIPALRFGWLTPIYDPVLRRMMPEVALKQRLVAQAQIAAGQRVFDLGAGTGTLAIILKQACQGADVVGLDGDPRVLAIARDKAAAAGMAIRFDQGLATALPYDDASFDRVFSSLMLHHLIHRGQGACAVRSMACLAARRGAARPGFRPAAECAGLADLPGLPALGTNGRQHRGPAARDVPPGRLHRRRTDGAAYDDSRHPGAVPGP